MRRGRTHHGALALEHALEDLGVGLQRLHRGLDPGGVQGLGTGQPLLDVLQLRTILRSHLRHLRHFLHHGGVGGGLQKRT